MATEHVHCSLLTAMEDTEDYGYIKGTYLEMFGPSQMGVLFEKKPEDGKGRFRWRLRKAVCYFFVFYYPAWLALEFSGIIWGRKGDMDEITFAIAYMSHMSQTVIKLNYVILKVKDFKGLFINFDKLHAIRHRPGLARAMLEESCKSLRKTAKLYYRFVFLNVVAWFATPLVIQPIRVILHHTGVLEDESATLIPDIFPVIYSFEDRTTWYMRTLTGILEWVVLTGGLIYSVTMELFFMSLFLLLAAEMDVIAKSAQSAGELRNNIKRDYSSLLGPRDDRDRINIRLFIQDHQHVLKKIKDISNLMAPLLGLAVCNCLTQLSTLCVIITTIIKSSESILGALKACNSWFMATLIWLMILFLYSWICAKLKDSEEAIFDEIYSTNWYEMDNQYRKTMLLIMAKSLRPRKMRMLYFGDMDRETFIAGLKAFYSFYNFLLGFQ